jgi:hypothetical protein
MGRKLTASERFLLRNQGDNYNSFLCPVHGITQAPTSHAIDGTCPWPNCKSEVVHIADPVAYEKAN